RGRFALRRRAVAIEYCRSRNRTRKPGQRSRARSRGGSGRRSGTAPGGAGGANTGTQSGAARRAFSRKIRGCAAVESEKAVLGDWPLERRLQAAEGGKMPPSVLTFRRLTEA